MSKDFNFLATTSHTSIKQNQHNNFKILAEDGEDDSAAKPKPNMPDILVPVIKHAFTTEIPPFGGGQCVHKVTEIERKQKGLLENKTFEGVDGIFERATFDKAGTKQGRSSNKPTPDNKSYNWDTWSFSEATDESILAFSTRILTDPCGAGADAICGTRAGLRWELTPQVGVPRANDLVWERKIDCNGICSDSGKGTSANACSSAVPYFRRKLKSKFYSSYAESERGNKEYKIKYTVEDGESEVTVTKKFKLFCKFDNSDTRGSETKEIDVPATIKLPKYEFEFVLKLYPVFVKHEWKANTHRFRHNPANTPEEKYYYIEPDKWKGAASKGRGVLSTRPDPNDPIDTGETACNSASIVAYKENTIVEDVGCVCGVYPDAGMLNHLYEITACNMRRGQWGVLVGRDYTLNSWVQLPSYIKFGSAAAVFKALFGLPNFSCGKTINLPNGQTEYHFDTENHITLEEIQAAVESPFLDLWKLEPRYTIPTPTVFVGPPGLSGDDLIKKAGGKNIWEGLDAHIDAYRQLYRQAATKALLEVQEAPEPTCDEEFPGQPTCASYVDIDYEFEFIDN